MRHRKAWSPRRLVIVGAIALVAGALALVNPLARAETTSPAADRPAGTATVAAAPALPAPVSCPGCWHPPVRVSWNWVISKVPRAPFRNVEMYDIDGFDAPASTVSALHNAGKKVVCYISAGSFEEGRPDEDQFPDEIKGKPLKGFEDERWLDVRDVQRPGSPLARIMNKRMDMCKAKGFDAVEFDNVDGFTNPTGFPLTGSDQAFYNVFLANGARSRGMSAVLKNDLDQIGQLLPYFDMALNEQCNEFEECDKYDRVIRAGKPVFNAEYEVSPDEFCDADNDANINGVFFSDDLDDSVFRPCR